MAILQSDKLFIFANSPDAMTIGNYYFMLNDAQIGNAYKEEYKSENEAGIL